MCNNFASYQKTSQGTCPGIKGLPRKVRSMLIHPDIAACVPLAVAMDRHSRAWGWIAPVAKVINFSGHHFLALTPLVAGCALREGERLDSPAESCQKTDANEPFECMVACSSQISCTAWMFTNAPQSCILCNTTAVKFVPGNATVSGLRCPGTLL